jgi:hypothetical protein
MVRLITDLTPVTIISKRVIPSNVTMAIGQTMQFYLETAFSDGGSSTDIVSGMGVTGGVLTGPGLFSATAPGIWTVSYPNAESATVVIQSIASGGTDVGTVTIDGPATPPSAGGIPGVITADGLSVTVPVMMNTFRPDQPPTDIVGIPFSGRFKLPTGTADVPGQIPAPIPGRTNPSTDTADVPGPTPGRIKPPTGSFIPPTTPTPPDTGFIPTFVPPTTPTLDQFLYFSPSSVDVTFIKNSGLGIQSQTVQVGNNSPKEFLEVNFVNTPLVTVTPATIGLSPNEVKTVVVSFTLTELTNLQEGLYTLGIKAEVRGPHL